MVWRRRIASHISAIVTVIEQEITDLDEKVEENDTLDGDVCVTMFGTIRCLCSMLYDLAGFRG